MNLHLYPHDWPALAREIKEACDYQCTACGLQCRRPGEFYLGWQYEMHIAHWDQDYDGAAIFVVACCAKCHFKHDAPFVWRARRRVHHWRQRGAGQLELLAARG